MGITFVDMTHCLRKEMPPAALSLPTLKAFQLWPSFRFDKQTTKIDGSAEFATQK